MIIFDDFSAPRTIRIRTLPGVDCGLAIWTAQAPEREPMKEDARCIRAAMPDSAIQDLQTLNRGLFRWPLAASAMMFRLGGSTPEDALCRLAEEPPRRVVGDLLLSSLQSYGQQPHDFDVDPLTAVIESTTGQGDVLGKAQSLIRQPERTARMVRTVLQAFFEAGFARRWGEQGAEIGRTVQALEARVGRDRARFLTSVSPRVFHDVRADRLLVVSGAGARVVSCKNMTSVDIMPTMWLQRGVALAWTPSTVGLSLHCRSTTADAGIAPPQMMEMLKALADGHRFEIVRLCLERPRTTTELAPLLHLTEAPVSRHLKKLEQAGLVVGQRTGFYVTYTAAIEMVSFLGAGLQHLPEIVNRQVANANPVALVTA